MGGAAEFEDECLLPVDNERCYITEKGRQRGKRSGCGGAVCLMLLLVCRPEKCEVIDAGRLRREGSMANKKTQNIGRVAAK